MGRPSTYSDEYCSDICDHIAMGKSLVSWCKSNSVGYSTVMQWLEANTSFADKYTHAREHQADYLADELIEISDEADVKYIKDGQDERLALDPTAVARNRLRIDTRKWAASKLKPKKYGEKQLGDADSPVHVVGALRWMDDK